MDEVIARATYEINQQLQGHNSQLSDLSISQLTDTCDLLHQLLQPDLPKNNWTRLFGRQLERLLSQDGSLPKDFWIQLHDDILYTLGKLDGEQNKSDSWARFLEKMKFEAELERREFQFDRMFGKRKELHQLLNNKLAFFEKYFQKCISLHLTIEVRGLIENIDDLCRHSFGQTEILFSTDSKKRIEDKLNRLEISFDCSNRLLNSADSSLFLYNTSSTIDNDSPINFLPSLEQIKIDPQRSVKEIENALRTSRWLVILGDPGSAKTTLLRWITRIFAQTAYREYQEGVNFPVRIPILIRMGEFAEWLVQHSRKTLIDYIGEHTWFAERYCIDQDRSVLQELIYHGHALILLDGLDEIPEIGQRKVIVELVRKFIDEYVRTSDLISPFDERMFSTRMSWHYGTMDIQSPKMGSNQIIITSRVVGYQLYPLDSSLIEHYLLSLINHEEAKQFVQFWITQVEKSVLDAFSNEGILFDEKAAKNFFITRYNAVEAIFESGVKLILSSPFLLTLICTLIFQSSVEFHPKTRIEIYSHVIQASLRSWKSQQSNIPESVLVQVLIDLAMYLHLRSSSGLIDGFDMKQLCCLTFQRQGLSDNRTQLRTYADEFLALLNSNVGIVAERSLQVFGFLHLSFQEYFVAQSFVRGSSMANMAIRIVSFNINSRFRESLLLAIGWISWKSSFDDYEQFCTLLFTPNKDYVFPFGTILFFDAFNDLHRLPSNAAMCIALNSLLDHPSNTMAPTYLLSNLSKLDETIIVQWTQIYLCENKKRLLKFCQCLPISLNGQYRDLYSYEKLIIPLIFRNLQMLYHTHTDDDEIIIDQFLRGLIKLGGQSDDNFNKQFSSYLSNIHPLIFSVIIAVCGGIYFRSENNGILKIDFSPEQMTRQSTILSSIMDYFSNTKESHAIKIRILINEYENILEKSLLTDTSLNTIDTFIALICLQGLSQPLFYQKYHDYQALSLAIDRLKRTWFYLKKLYKNRTSLKDEIESILKEFFTRPDQSIEQDVNFSLACAAAWKKLSIGDTSDWLRFNVLHNNNVRHYLECQPEFLSSTKRSSSTQLRINNLSLEMLDQKCIFLLTFIPRSLQQLYHCMTIAPTNATDSVPLVVLLSQSLTLLETLSEIDEKVGQALSILQSLFKEYMLENYALVLLGEQYCSRLFHNIQFKGDLKDKKNMNMFGFGLSIIDQPINWKALISTERQRIDSAKTSIGKSEIDYKLFASSISLARVFQGQYRFHGFQRQKHTNLPSSEAVEIHLTVEHIHDSILQIIALSIILEMKNPPIFSNEQEEQLQDQMIRQLEQLLPDLSLVKSTLLFIRCYSAYPLFPASFQLMAKIIGEKLIETSFDKENSENKEAAFIALQQLDSSDLFPYLSQFIKQTSNIANLFQFNSMIFSKYFLAVQDFNSSNSILLSSMYLAELTFDIQITKMYTNNEQIKKSPSINDFKRLWDDSWKATNVMTFEVAIWITNNLFLLDRDDVRSIMSHIYHCRMIERKALSVIQKWLDYRKDKESRFFRHFAALQLIIEGSNTSQLIDIINEIFTTDRDFDLRYIASQLFSSRFVDITVLRQILIRLHENVDYASRISAWIERQDILELIFNLELERIIAHENHPSIVTTPSYLIMIKGCSEDLQLYLIDYFRLFIDVKNEIENMIKEKFLAMIIQWITMSLLSIATTRTLPVKFYEYILTFLDDSQFPQIQRAVFDALNCLFITLRSAEENIRIQHIALPYMVHVINSYAIYAEDVLSICLLAFGNCLLKSKEFETKYVVPNEVLNICTHLFETSCARIISIRAGFCLIFTQYSNVISDTIQNWFRKKLNITYDIKYQILLQQTLYKMKTSTDHLTLELNNDNTRTYSPEMMDKFVLDLYNYLSKEYDNNSFSASAPSYIFIAKQLIEEDLKVFRNAVQRSSFGEENFRKILYHCFCFSTDHVICTLFVNLYAIFGTITIELADMLESPKTYFDDYMWTYFNGIERITDQNVINKLFQTLDFTLSNIEFTRFSFILRLFIQLGQVHLVSLSEVHQYISNAIEKLSSDHDYINKLDKDRIFQYLLNLSCAKETKLSLSKVELITIKDIAKEFDNELYNINEKSVLFLKRNYFLKEFRAIF